MWYSTFKSTVLFGTLVTLLTLSCKDPATSAAEPTLSDSTLTTEIKLTSLPSSQTGVNFNNQINDEGRINIFTWHFIYNGAGVAAGDINNDGLPDLYFSGNMVPDKLYLNKGNFQFEDITSNAGISTQIWSTGVTMADINADGLLDIYVCKNSPTGIHDNNRNKLYINMGDNLFREQAAKYGIEDIGFGVQSTFFDADQDGDLDMYLVNQPFDEFARLVNKPEIVASYPQSDRFFFFENGKFIDKTIALGLSNARYGLNVSLGDYDMNGWTDLYVCNDYHHADHMYMNNRGKFTDEIQTRTGHISFYSMGSDVADINQDGWLDLFTLDMAFEDHYRSKTNMGSMNRQRFWDLVADQQHYQYMQNCLQVNKGNGYFAEQAQISGISKSDWSFSAMFADLDHDSDQDVMITNGILRDLRNNDFNKYVKDKYQNVVGPDNYMEVLKNIPSTPIRNYIFKNEGNMQFSKLPPSSGFETGGFSHGMAVVDLNRDGLLDVVVNNSNAPASIYKNESSTAGHYIDIRLKGPGINLAGLGSTVIVYAGGKKQANTMQTTRGYFSASEAVLHFGLGTVSKIDSIKVFWDHKSISVLRNVGVDKQIVIQYDKEKKIPFTTPSIDAVMLVEAQEGIFQHKEKDFDDYILQVLLPYKLSQNGPFITVGDVNGDTLEDFHIGGGAGQGGMVFIQNADGVFHAKPNPAFMVDKDFDDQEAVFLDIDADGDQDLIVVSGSYEINPTDRTLGIRSYINDGTGTFSKSTEVIPTNILVNAQCIEAFDADGDQDQDLFIGGRMVGGKYPVPASSVLLINDQGKFVDKSATLAPFLKDVGLVTDAIADDIDKDGDDDLIVCGEWMQPLIIINNGTSGLQHQPFEAAGTGIWWTIEKMDVDADGDSDFLLGNLGWNNKFGGAKGTKLEVFANDFDENGDFDVVLASTKEEKLLPVRGRECSSEEMPFILEKFPTYESYAKAELTEILTTEQLESGMHQKLSTLSSLLLINNGDGNFAAKELNAICQTGPVKAFQGGDFDRDGKADYVYGGNHLPTEVETARYDGLFPGICYGDGQGNFNCKSIFIEGKLRYDDVRDIKVIKSAGGGNVILMSNNNGPLRVYAMRQ